MRHNIHATAVIIGDTGILFVGASGSGKSLAALDCLDGARSDGLAALLISDDRVDIEATGAGLAAHRPEAIAGLIEVRGSGIFKVENIETGLVSLAVRPMHPPFHERLPPTDERHHLAGDHTLPLVRIPASGIARPWSVLRLILAERRGILPGWSVA